MASTLSPPMQADMQAEFFEEQWTTAPAADRKLRPGDRSRARFSRTQPSRAKRAARAFARFLITVGLGIGGTLAWQSYGDQARQMIATAYPQQLGWLVPSPAAPASVAQIAPAAAAPAPTAAPSVDPRQVKGILLNIAMVNDRVDQLATKLDFLQQQMAGEIAKLHASEQDILGRISSPPSAAPAGRPASRTPQAR